MSDPGSSATFPPLSPSAVEALFKGLTPLAGSIVVVKVGGEILESTERAKSFAEDLILLKEAGLRPILCHGGGPQLTKMMTKLGREPAFIDGHRVTDAETLELTSMVFLGTVNRQIVALLNSSGAEALGLSGVDGRLLVVKPRGEQAGFVGNVEQVHTELLTLLLDANLTPVIASLGIDSTGQTYNINADAVAGSIAKALRARALLLITNVSGLYRDFDDKESLIPEITREKLAVLASSSTLEGGMLPKVEAVVDAMAVGVSSSFILDGRVPHSMPLSLIGRTSGGTRITQS